MADQKNTSISRGFFMEKENKEETPKNEEEKQEELADLTEELKQEEPLPQEADKETEAAEEETPTPEEKEEAKPKKEKGEEEKEIVEERTYTVPLGKASIMPPNKRTPRAVHMLKNFIIKHMKLQAKKEGETEEEEELPQLTISNEVNEKMWERGIEKPPRKIRVRAEKDKEGNVTVYLAEGD
jgi:large subunit ribosomal protein L31e